MSDPAPIADPFDDLVREHQAGLRAFIRGLGAQDAWVDDIAQEVFLVAHRRQSAFVEGADSGRWLRGIARHLVLNERRKEARRSRLLRDSLADLLMDETCKDEASPLDVPRLLQAMRECVSALPSRSQELLRRRYAEDENATVLGRALGLGAAAVRQALARSRAAVKACVEGKLGEEWT